MLSTYNYVAGACARQKTSVRLSRPAPIRSSLQIRKCSSPSRSKPQPALRHRSLSHDASCAQRMLYTCRTAGQQPAVRYFPHVFGAPWSISSLHSPPSSQPCMHLAILSGVRSPLPTAHRLLSRPPSPSRCLSAKVSCSTLQTSPALLRCWRESRSPSRLSHELSLIHI